MPTDVIMPQMGESIFEGTLTKWLKKAGDKVQRDEPLFEISPDKVNAEIPAPSAGILTEIKVQPGTTVQVNTVVGVIGGTGAAAAPAPVAAPASQAAKPRAAEPAAKQPAVAAVAQQPSQVLSFPAVDRDQGSRRIRSSPLVRRLARDNHVALGHIAGTGLGARTTKNDIPGFVEKYGKGGAPAPAAAASAAVATTAPGPTLAATAPARPAAAASAAAHMPPPIPGELVPMTPMRKKIAERMVESKHTSAHVHTVFKVDMTRIVKIREREKAKFEQNHAVKLTSIPFIAT